MVKAHTGFEPVLGETAGDERQRREPDALEAPELPAELQRIVERVSRGRTGARE